MQNLQNDCILSRKWSFDVCKLTKRSFIPSYCQYQSQPSYSAPTSGSYCQMLYGLKEQLNFGKLAPNFYAKITYGNKVPAKQIRGIKNIHLNIRFLQNKMADIQLFVSQEKPHILGLSECEIRKTQGSFDENKLKLPGYRLLFPKSWSVQGKARVLVYVKSSLEIEQMDELEEISVQSIWFKAGFSNSKKIIFAHAYREHLSSLSNSLQQQKECLQKFLLQWEAASEIKIGSEESEIHVMDEPRCFEMA